MHSHLKGDKQKVFELVRDHFKELQDKYRGIFEKYVPVLFISAQKYDYFVGGQKVRLFPKINFNNVLPLGTKYPTTFLK